MVLREENGITVEVPLYNTKIQSKLLDLPYISSEQIKLHNSENDCWIIINNLVFEVSDFLNKHPGGKLVILNSGGKDVTDAFENYHNASIHNKLHPFLIGKVLADKLSDHLLAFRNLRQILLKNDMFVTNYKYYTILGCILLMLFTTSISLSCGMLDIFSYNMRLVGGFLLGIFWQQLSGIGHDLGHSSITHNFRKDHIIGSLLISVLGLSIGWWKIDHNNHHVNTNSIENDPNIQHLPLLATSINILNGFYDKYHKKNVVIYESTKKIISHQHLFVYPLIIFGRFNLYFQQLLFMYSKYDKHNFLKTEAYGFFIFVFWYILIAYSQPNIFLTLSWILISHITSGLLHIQIVISHWAMEKYMMNSHDDDWYMKQLKTTLNIKTEPSYLDFIHVGLQFQIEHHMYPRIPRHNLRKVRNMVQRICEKFNLNYVELSFLNANICTWKKLKEVSSATKYEKNKIQ
tara:strand:+ start:418 stop:1800 length:1383 start_codon:yes stop_codon:yes gene_type:complete